jgi:hypothetical protein
MSYELGSVETIEGPELFIGSFAGPKGKRCIQLTAADGYVQLGIDEVRTLIAILTEWAK